MLYSLTRVSKSERLGVPREPLINAHFSGNYLQLDEVVTVPAESGPFARQLST